MKTTAALLLFAPLVASASAPMVLVPPVPEFADSETCACSAIPGLSAGASETLTIHIELSNAATNQCEVWFCTDGGSTRACRDVLLKVDDGRLFIDGHNVGDAVHDGVLLPLGDISMDIVIVKRQLSGAVSSGVLVNGAPSAFLKTAVDAASPQTWRSIRVVSRGSVDEIPEVVVAKARIGTSIRLR